MATIPLPDRIEQVSCKHGNIYNSDTDSRIIIPKKSFNSQITFVVNSADSNNSKQHRMKLFRSGVYQMAGITQVNLEDAIEPIEIVYEYLLKSFPDIVPCPISSILRNYKCSLKDQYARIRINTLYNIVIPFTNKANAHFNYQAILTKLDEELREIIKVRIQKECGSIINIVQINESNSTLKLKRTRKDGKSTTVEIHKSGKININACLCHPEAIELQSWVNYILTTNPECIVDIRNIIADI
jgi:hypothetical protein